MHSVAVELTARCNQKCTYCYNAWRDDGGAAMGELDYATLIDVLDRILDEHDLAYLTLTGGEPFVRKDIHDIIDHINRRGVGVVIISNGGMIRDETIARLAQQHIHYIQVTLAGADATTHDALAGSGSFDRIMRAMRGLHAAGIDVGGSYLCTQDNYHQAGDIFARFADVGASQVAFNRFNPSGYSRAAMDALMPTRSQVVYALEQANATADARDLHVVCTMPIPPCVVDYASYPAIEFGFCSAGDPEGEVAIGPDGNVRLCTLLQPSLGNILESSLQSLWEKTDRHTFRRNVPQFCQGCLYADTCLGGCGAAAQWVLGHTDDLDPFVAQHVMPDFSERAMRRVHEPTFEGPIRVDSSGRLSLSLV